MRVRAHGMQQATDYPGPVAVLVTATVLVVMTVFVVVTRPVTLTRLVIVTVLVIMTVLVIAVWAAPAVHIIQHARENALPHINTYQGRALAN
jgi:hypothetical protein